MAFLVTMRSWSVSSQDMRWIACAPIVAAVFLAASFRFTGLSHKYSYLVGSGVALLASVFHALERVFHAPSFAFLLDRYYLDLTSDPMLNSARVVMTTTFALALSMIS